ncbi:MAG TPA: acetylornithine transaminase [Tepidiformaceae bacterium]|nr:acetylornithine transaminase [Tepidiformaceae bacterium]
MTDWVAEERRYVFQNYGRQPVVLERGEGTRVWDTEGKEYLDFVGGVAVNILGHSHPVVARALAEQAQTLIHTSNLFYTRPMIELAKLLVEHSCLDRVFFCNSGTEAVEGAIKLARRWGHDTKNGAFEIITTVDGFHGRSMGSLAATGNARYQEPFGPLLPGFHIVPWNDLDAIKAATTESTVAVMVEPIQGEGGVNMPAPGYLQGIRDWCDEKGLLLIFDEVQTGIGRTGSLFAYEQEGVEPDIMTLAKGLAGGVPIGAVMARDDIAAHLVKGDHGSTFAGGLVVTHVAHHVVSRINQPEFLASVQAKGKLLMDLLDELNSPHIKEVRGSGLMVGVEMDIDVTPIVNKGYERGLLLVSAGPNVLRFVPPLIITEDEIKRTVATVGEILQEV